MNHYNLNLLFIIILTVFIATNSTDESRVEVTTRAGQKKVIRNLQQEISNERNLQQMNLSSWNGDAEMRKYVLQLIDHHPHHGRRLQSDEIKQCLRHFELSEREVRLSLIGHILYDHYRTIKNEKLIIEQKNELETADSSSTIKNMKPIIVDHFLSLIESWDKKKLKPMHDWSNGSTYQGELQLLAHACIQTILQTVDGSKKVFSKLFF
jgi:hypothetical protein